MRYNQQLHYRQRKRFLLRMRLVSGLLVLTLFGGIGYIAYDNYRSEFVNTEEDTTSAQTLSYVAPSIQVFRSPYFQFQTNKSWAEDPAATTPNKFVYRSMRGGLLEQTLSIYINNPPKDLRPTRVVVVDATGSRGLKSLKLSDHCGKLSGYKNSSQAVTLESVNFTCFGDDTRFNVMAGIAGGGTSVTLPRPDGSAASYTLYYSNVTATPDAVQFQEIINTFQTR